MLGAEFRIKYWYPRMLFFHHPCHRLFQRHVCRQGEDPAPWHQDFPHGHIPELQSAMDHVFLEFWKQAHTAAGGDDEFQFFGGVNAALAHKPGAEGLEHYVGRPVHEPYERP